MSAKITTYQNSEFGYQPSIVIDLAPEYSGREIVDMEVVPFLGLYVVLDATPWVLFVPFAYPSEPVRVPAAFFTTPTKISYDETTAKAYVLDGATITTLCPFDDLYFRTFPAPTFSQFNTDIAAASGIMRMVTSTIAQNLGFRFFQYPDCRFNDGWIDQSNLLTLPLEELPQVVNVVGGSSFEIPVVPDIDYTFIATGSFPELTIYDGLGLFLDSVSNVSEAFIEIRSNRALSFRVVVTYVPCVPTGNFSVSFSIKNNIIPEANETCVLPQDLNDFLDFPVYSNRCEIFPSASSHAYILAIPANSVYGFFLGYSGDATMTLYDLDSRELIQRFDTPTLYSEYYSERSREIIVSVTEFPCLTPQTPGQIDVCRVNIITDYPSCSEFPLTNLDFAAVTTFSRVTTSEGCPYPLVIKLTASGNYPDLNLDLTFVDLVVEYPVGVIISNLTVSSTMIHVSQPLTTNFLTVRRRKVETKFISRYLVVHLIGLEEL